MGFKAFLALGKERGGNSAFFSPKIIKIEFINISVVEKQVNILIIKKWKMQIIIKVKKSMCWYCASSDPGCKTKGKLPYIMYIIYFCYYIYWIWTCPTYAHSSSFSPPAEIIMIIMVIVAGGNNYNYNFLIPNYNYEYLYYHYQKAISNIGTKILTFTCFFTTDMFINANLTIFGAAASDFPPLSNPLGPKA